MMKKFHIFLIFLIPIIEIGLFIESFPFPATGHFSDLLITHYPNAIFLKETISVARQIPLWTTTILGGYPFAANPLSGLWYPFGWIPLLFPLPEGFNLSIIAHLIWGGWGMYKFLIFLGKEDFASVCGALIFETMPKIFAHYAAGHITLIYAIMWTPWLLLSLIKILQEKRYKNIGIASLVWGMIIFADVRWVFYAGVLWIAIGLYQILLKEPEYTWNVNNFGKTLMLAGKTIISPIVIGTLVSSPLIFPLVEFLSLSTRKNLTPDDILGLSLPPVRILNIIVPSIGNYAEWVCYFGIFCVFAVVIICNSRYLFRNNIFWLLLCGGSFLMSLGEYFPGMKILTYLPGFNLLRVPARFMLLTGFSLSVISANAIQAIVDNMGSINIRILIVPTIVILGVSVGIYQFYHPHLHSLWGGLIALALLLIIILVKTGLCPKRYLLYILLTLILLDLVGTNYFSVRYYDKNIVERDGQLVSSYLKEKEGIFRIYSPSFSIPPHIAVKNHLEMADGIDPIQLFDYVNYMQMATGIINKKYSVTLPPFETGHPDIDNQDSKPDARKLGLLNVKYVISEFDIHADGLLIEKQLGDTRVYRNKYFLPRAWVQDGVKELGEGVRSFPQISLTPNRISISHVKGPGLLVLSEISYPGWNVRVDGKIKKIELVGSLFRSVTLEKGEHSVDFFFVPLTVYIGLFISLISMVIITILFLRQD